MKQETVLIGVIILGLLITGPVMAQTIDTQTNTGVSVTAEVVTDGSGTVPTAAVEVNANTEVAVDGTVSKEQNKKPPTGLGLFFLGLRERLSLLATPDPVRKAEKQALFAEERVAIAEQLLSADVSEEAKIRANTVMQRAEALLESAKKREEIVQEHPDARAVAALRNIAESQVRLGVVLDRMEARLPESVRDTFEVRREAIEEKSQGIMRAIQNDNLSPEVKEHLKAIQVRIDARAEATKAFRVERQELLEKAANGDVEAKAELQALQSDRRATIEGMRENYSEAKESLKEAAKNGNTAASKTLQMLDRVEGRVMQRTEERREDRKESTVLPVRAMQRARELQRKVDTRNAEAKVELEGNARIVQ